LPGLVAFEQCSWNDTLGQEPFELPAVLLGGLAGIEGCPQVLGQELVGDA
jgi:hypothetical protein